jgi:hypothetical protein
MYSIPYIAFDVKKYNDFDDMMYDVRNVMCVLVKNDYEVVFRYEDAGIYILEYGHNNESFGSPMAYWLYPEDYQDFMFMKESPDAEVHQE